MTSPANYVKMGTMKTSTIYQKGIKLPSDAKQVIKKGSGNKKLGYKITSKKWRGKRLYSLTLVERETCPTSCHHWNDCYGNNMPFAHRYSTEGLTERLEIEVAELMSKHKEGIAIRLHVLGDFYSTQYVNFWQSMLLQYPKLSVFGYTGRELSSDIGNSVRNLNISYPEQWVVRYSRNHETTSKRGGEWFAAEESFDGPAFDCPEQTGKVKDCASCGLCWSVAKTVRFLTH